MSQSILIRIKIKLNKILLPNYTTSILTQLRLFFTLKSVILIYSIYSCKQPLQMLQQRRNMNKTLARKSQTPITKKHQSFSSIIKSLKLHPPPQNLIICNYKRHSKNIKISKISLQSKPIHSPNFSKTLQRFKQQTSRIPSQQLPQSQRVNKMRLARYNEFNRRSYQEKSPQKNSLYGKSIRKCKSVLMRVQFQTAIQNMIGKKQIMHKQKTLRENQQFLSRLKEKLHTENQTMKSLHEAKKIMILKPYTPIKFQDMLQSTSNSYHLKPTSKKYQTSFKLMHSRLNKLMEQNDDLRPWGDARKILTQPAENQCGSSRNNPWIPTQI